MNSLLFLARCSLLFLCVFGFWNSQRLRVVKVNRKICILQNKTLWCKAILHWFKNSRAQCYICSQKLWLFFSFPCPKYYTPSSTWNIQMKICVWNVKMCVIYSIFAGVRLFWRFDICQLSRVNLVTEWIWWLIQEFSSTKFSVYLINSSFLSEATAKTIRGTKSTFNS